MQMKLPCRLIFLFLCVLFLVSAAQAQTLTISVFEKTANVTPIPYASVFVNGALAGKTGTDGIFTFTHPGTTSLDVKVLKPGYESWEDEVGMAETGILVQLKKKMLTLTLNIFDTDSALPIPNAGVKITSSNLTDLMEKTDSNGTLVIPTEANGVYTITISAPNYEDRTAIVEMGTEAKTIQYLLTRSDRFSIFVKDGRDQSPVAGAEIFIDGVSKGKTDPRGILTLEIPRNKVYNIKVQKTGFIDYTEKRNIGENEAVVNTVLSVAPYTPSVNVFDEAKTPVEGATVIINGNPVGTTNQYGKYIFQNLPPGEYLLEVRHAGYSPVHQDIGQDVAGKDVAIVLPAAQTDLTIFVEDTGHVVLPGAAILLNSNNAGVTDTNGMLQIKVKENVENNITALKDGYQQASIMKVVNPGSNGTSSITITMEKSLNIGLILVGGVAILVVLLVILMIMRLKRNRPKKLHSTNKPHGEVNSGKKGDI
jgi:Carboxypeptidase regulatory-like domain